MEDQRIRQLRDSCAYANDPTRLDNLRRWPMLTSIAVRSGSNCGCGYRGFVTAPNEKARICEYVTRSLIMGTYCSCVSSSPSNPMPLKVWEAKLVPMFTPCSAASFRLKNIRLPRMHSSVGLPVACSTAAGMRDAANLLSKISITEHHIALNGSTPT